MSASNGKVTTVQYAMSTRPTEFGMMGAEGLRDLVKRATGYAPITTYVEAAEPPVSWAALAAAGWDQFGLMEDGEGPSRRDLLAVAAEWGYGSIQLPLLTTLVARRHSTLASEVSGPVTFSLAYGTQSLIPYASIPDITYIEAIGSPDEQARAVPEGRDHDLDRVNRGRIVDEVSTLPEVMALELAIVLGGEALGGAERLLADTVEFVKTREQFGRPVGSFQAVKHKLANAAVAVESAETALILSSQSDADTYDAVLFAVDRCIDVAEIAIQAHGGIGFTWEAGLHFPYRTMLSTRRIVEQLGKN